MQRVVMFSGGIGSWAAARRVADLHGTDDLLLFFTDTKMEDEDLYRFLREAAADVGGRLVMVEEGRDPWQVFFDVRYLGNTQADPCSRILKRGLAHAWLKEHCDPKETVVYVGIDWTEEHRYLRLRDLRAEQGWTYEAPMCEAPYVTKADMMNDLRSRGIDPPRLYGMGFSHNNCGGFCIKAGQGHFAVLLREMPERYAYHEAKEQEIREFLGADVSILRDRTGGETKKMTLKDLRFRIESGGTVDMFEVGGCGCFVGSGEELSAGA